jgi:hypothetical protein
MTQLYGVFASPIRYPHHARIVQEISGVQVNMPARLRGINGKKWLIW